MNVSTVKAIITGGASGLGRATAARLLGDGARVAIVDRPASAGAEVAKELGARAAFTPADVTSVDEVAAAVARPSPDAPPVTIAFTVFAFIESSRAGL